MTELKPQVWFPFYLKDFLVDTARLNASQRWDYVMLLGHQWYQGHFRKEDIPAIVGLNSEILESSSATSQLEFSQAVTRRLQPIIEMLSVDEAGLYFSPRMDRELMKAIENRRSHAERGRKGGMEKQRRRVEKIASSASSSALAEGVATGLAKSYPAPAPVEKQKQLPPFPPGEAGAPAGGLSPHPPPPAVSIANSKQGEDKEKPPKRPLGAITGPSIVGRGQGNSVKGVQQSTNSKNGASTHRGDSDFGDPRFATFKAEILAFWRGQNPNSALCPWIRSDDRALSEYLAGNPAAGLQHFKQLLLYRAESEVNPSDPPRRWVRDLERFASGALDRYGKVLQAARRL